MKDVIPGDYIMIRVVVLILLTVTLSCVVTQGQQTCGRLGTFGARTSNCHSANGACWYDTCLPNPNQGGLSGCAATWSGPSCQIKNEAQGKVTKQKSTWEEDSERAISALAVDGYTFQQLFTVSGNNPLSCTHTLANTDYPWWQVDFGELVDVFYIKIWNRAPPDCCGHRLNRFIVSAKNTTIDSGTRNPNVGTQCYSYDGNRFSTKSFNCGRSLTTQYINIMIPSTNAQPLTLCEVEIYVCADYWFGEDCSKQCYCHDITEVCNKHDGSCPVSGCAAGKTGTDCQQGCSSTKFGKDCADDCHCQYSGNVCNGETGDCVGGCAKGWTGTACQDECPPGMHGFGCTDTCNCYDDEPCDRFDGSCAECAAGYRGTACKRECDGRTFGRGCLSQCNCRDTFEQCGHINGNCSSGCAAGFQGVNCLIACDAGLFGFECAGVCHCKAGIAACNPVNGECDGGCSSGYLGNNCSQACDAGHFGANCNDTCSCLEADDICDHISGNCRTCAAGFQGINCKTDCDSGSFGPGCEGVCHCADNTQCSQFNGTCGASGCAEGHKGPTCQECGPGEFGPGCAGVCHCADNSACLPQNGECGASGCAERYTGSTCQTLKQVAPGPDTGGTDDDNTGAIAGGVVGAIVLIALVIILVLVLRRRRSAPAKKEKPIKVKKRERETGQAAHANGASVHISGGYDDGLEHEDDWEVTGDTVNHILEVEEPTYANVERNTDIPIGTIIEQVTAKLNDHQAMSKEYQDLPKGLLEPVEAAKRPENRGKCRYKSIVPYDHTRVILTGKISHDGSDFINANYIDGYSKTRMYIAAQGPTDVFVPQFWVMIWECNVRKILMLTNLIEVGQTKCARYWPEKDTEPMKVIGLTINLESVEDYQGFCIRNFAVKKGTDPVRHIQQFHFTSWPDHGAPHDTTEIIKYRDKVLETNDENDAPLLVHCSAGVGRTGTYITFDYMMEKAAAEGLIDVFMFVQGLRHQRTNMIQTQEQYAYVYRVLMDAIACKGNSHSASQFLVLLPQYMKKDRMSGWSQVERAFETLELLRPKHDDDDYKTARETKNLSKNRVGTCLAADEHRVFTSTHIPGRTAYINAVLLPIHRANAGMISAQAPLSHTIIDFWRMVHDYRSHTIVMLNATQHDKEIYWPTGNTVKEVAHYRITLVNETERAGFTTRHMTLSDTTQTEIPSVEVHQYSITDWRDGEDVPSDTATILGVIDEVLTWQRQSGNSPIIVHCLSGAEKTGLFCAALNLIETLKTEQTINVMLNVKQMRTKRRQFIGTYAQYKFLYTILRDYLEGFQTYQNFQ